MTWLGLAATVVGIMFFVLDVYLAYVSMGFRKSNCKKCKGYLKEIVHTKNKYVGGKSGRFYKDYVNYRYTYRVNGSEYTVHGGTPGVKGDVGRIVDVKYQKNAPRYAYVEGLTFPVQPILAILIIPVWIMIITCGIMLLLGY